MRVNKLELQAFGPFKNKEIINFSNFGKEGIFLISGETGSGKTSIFDAISYALFGNSSSGDRDESMLRYASADPDQETYVKLDFSYKGKEYSIWRRPKYLRSKKSGDGLTDLGTKKLILTFDNEKNLEDREAEAKIQKLLGIDKNQFNQIAMLAQGDFMKFLKANSDEKVKLFRYIFETHNFQKLEQNVNEKFKAAQDNYRKLEDKKESLIQNFEISSDSVEEFSYKKNSGVSYLISFMNDNIQEDTKQEKKLKDKIDKLVIERDDKLSLIDKIKANKAILKDLRDKKEELDNIQEDYKISLDRFNNLDIKENARIDILKTIDKLEAEKEKYSEYTTLIENIKLNESKKIEIENELNTIEEDIKIIQESINDSQKYIEENEDIKDRKIKAENLKREYKLKLDKLKDISSNELLVTGYQDQKNILEKKYQKSKDEYKSLSSEYREYLDLYLESQAGILASDLKDNQACPVCGSLDHPNLAELHHEFIDKNMVDDLKLKEEAKREEKEKYLREILQINTKVDELEDHIRKDKKDLNLDGDLELNIRDLTNQISEIDKEINNFDDLLLKADNEKRNLLDKKKLEEEKNISNKELNFKLSEVSALLKVLEENKKTEEIKFKGRKLEDIDKEIREYSKELDRLKIEIGDIRSKFDELHEIKIKLEESIKINRQKYDKKYDLDLNAVEEEFSYIEGKLQELRNENVKLNNRILNNQKNASKLSEMVSSIEVAEKDLQDLKELASVLKGNINGLENIKFETFVQGKYFDQVLNYANERFYTMTEGKFSLKRKLEAGNKNRQTGLDIDVIDHQNKKIREVNTLSGGESFQASLSLALGLSDVVQMNSGGIQIDSMFVDEGFGTLDRETLSKVMSTLAKISSSNKLIGIISHVDSLKEQLDKKIIVEKTNSGYSFIKDVIYWLKWKSFVVL